MPPIVRNAMLLVSALLLAACGAADRAAVFIAPPLEPHRDDLLAAIDHRPVVNDAFERFTSDNGYRCHSAMRRQGRRVCRGPRDLHMTFEPRLNGEGYVAGFSWVRTEGRTTAEFRHIVQQFSQSLSATGASVDVRMGEFAE